MAVQDLINTKTWNDAQLAEATKMLCETLNTSKVSLKNQIKAGGFFMVHENCIQSHNFKYDIGVYPSHEIFIGMYVNEDMEDFESMLKWEDFIKHPNLVIDEFKKLRESLGLKV